MTTQALDAVELVDRADLTDDQKALLRFLVKEHRPPSRRRSRATVNGQGGGEVGLFIGPHDLAKRSGVTGMSRTGDHEVRYLVEDVRAELCALEWLVAAPGGGLLPNYEQLEAGRPSEETIERARVAKIRATKGFHELERRARDCGTAATLAKLDLQNLNRSLERNLEERTKLEARREAAAATLELRQKQAAEASAEVARALAPR